MLSIRMAVFVSEVLMEMPIKRFNSFLHCLTLNVTSGLFFQRYDKF